MEKIKSLSQKQADGSFSQAIPFGADAENIDLKEGINLEEKFLEIYNNFLIKILQVFYVVDNDTLYSVFSTAWQVESNALRLLPDYFTLEALDNGHYKMTVKNIYGQIIE